MRLAALGLVLLACGAATPAAAQDPAPAGGAAPYIEPGHWAHDAVRRLDGMGLLPPGYDRGMWLLDRVQAVALIDAAATRAAETHPPLLPLVRGWVARLRAEFPAAAARADGGAARVEAGRLAAGGGFRAREGDVLTGLGAPPTLQEDPREVPAVSTAVAALDASAYGGRRWAARAQVALLDGGAELGESYAVLDAGPLSVWAGRRAMRLGSGEEAVVLSVTSPADGFGLDTEALRLPWVLDALGPVRAKMALVRLGDVAPFEHPWLWVLRGSFQPHPRFTFGLNRSAMVAAPDQTDGDFLKLLAYVLIGKHPEGEVDRDDNQIASVDLLYRPPLGVLPLSLYLEWGLEDSAGSWRDVPGVVAGARLAALPGLPRLGTGLEYASFARMCCGNPWWYRHRGFAGGWTDERRPLAHPLGGHGNEWAGHLDASLPWAGVELGTRFYWRDRQSENLFAPLLEGESRGAALDLQALIGGDVRARVRGEYESGEGWRRTVVELGAFWLF